jgi:hypothetical protein
MLEPVLKTEVMVAGVAITMVVPLAEAMLAPAGMPAPEMMRPGATPVRLDTPVMVGLPEVTRPVVEKLAVMGPVPTTTELTLDTVLMTLLPETVMPVAEAVLDAVALAFMVTVVVPTFVMTVLAAIPVPVRGCPIAAWETDVADVRIGLPMVAMAPNVALVLLD